MGSLEELYGHEALQANPCHAQPLPCAGLSARRRAIEGDAEIYNVLHQRDESSLWSLRIAISRMGKAPRAHYPYSPQLTMGKGQSPCPSCVSDDHTLHKTDGYTLLSWGKPTAGGKITPMARANVKPVVANENETTLPLLSR